ASSPSPAASATSSSGRLAPSRKLKLEWQCSSAYGVRPFPATLPPPSGAGESTARNRSIRLAVRCALSESLSRSPDSVLFQVSLHSSSCQSIGGLFQPISRTLLRPTTVDFDVLPSAVAARFPMSPCRRTTRPGSVPTHHC